MKKLFTLLAVLSFALLTGCGETTSDSGSTDDFQQGSTNVKGLNAPDTVSIVDAKDE